MGVDYPYGYVRWTEKRNMDEFLSLLKQSQVSVEKLITHQFAIEDGEKAYDVIMNDQKKSLAVLLSYESPQEQSQRIRIGEAASGQQSSMPEIGIGSVGLQGKDLEALGIPTEEAYVARYCERTGRAEIADRSFYTAFNLFRLAAILQGIAGRVRDGTAASAHASQAEKAVLPLAELGWHYMR